MEGSKGIQERQNWSVRFHNLVLTLKFHSCCSGGSTAVFPLLGKSYTDFVANKEAMESGTLKLPVRVVGDSMWQQCSRHPPIHTHTHTHTQVKKATPGLYEVRYCPAWLDSSRTPYRHTLYWAPTPLTVTQP